MNPRVLSALGLLSCFSFLIFNIIFDWLDNPTIECYDPGAADFRLFFIPLFLMVDAIIFCAYESFKKLGNIHRILWMCFVFLSSAQTIKNLFFDPTKRNYSDYAGLLCVIIYLLYNLKKHQKT